MLPWSAYSSDLSPMEHIWYVIGHHLDILPLPHSEYELFQMFDTKWRAIPQEAIRSLIDSVPRSAASYNADHGGPTAY